MTFKNEMLKAYKEKMKGKKVAVIGLGVSNTPLVRQLADIGALVRVCDKSDAAKLERFTTQLEGLNVTYTFGEGYLDNLDGYDYIFRTPVVRFDLPELAAAAAQGTVITSEMEVFFELCPAQIIAVTGSDGKTTTTTLIYKILQQAGFKCWLGGNIGNPLLPEIENILPDDKVVLELSSFQLQTMKSSAHIAIMTNLSPNHLDIHKSMEEYVDSKKNIFLHQQSTGKLIINYDCELTQELKAEAPGEAIFFSRRTSADVFGGQGAYIDEAGMLTYRRSVASAQAERLQEKREDYRLVSADKIVIPGNHNIENYLAASAAVFEVIADKYGPECAVRAIYDVATSFTGVAHRIELVRTLDGVRYYNDSIASSPSRTTAGLNSFPEKVILIAGGKDKGIPYDEMGELLAKRVKKLVLLGQTAAVIEKAYREYIQQARAAGDNTIAEIPVFHCKTMEDAVITARDNAEQGDIVILSPASTSFDMFRNFEERGNVFKDIVNKL